MTSDLLHDRDGALADQRSGHRVGAHALARDAAGGVGGVEEGNVTDAETTVLYALSTLAQTCAALAAFVGAVGIYRLQLLRAGQSTTERNLGALAARENLGVGSDLAALLPIEHIVNLVEKADPKQGPASKRALGTWRAFPCSIQRSRTALLIFEAWNLLVIFVSLVGFNYVTPLASSPCSFWGLWAAAVGTVVATGYCVYAWTRG
jgi:hypothetical protein